MAIPATSDRLSPRVTQQLERLGGKLPSTSGDRSVETLTGRRTLPAPIAALAAVEWPRGHRLRSKDPDFEQVVELQGMAISEDYLRDDRRAWFSIAYDGLQFFYFIDLDDPDPTDPEVYRVDHEGDSRTPSSRRLSDWLATLDAEPRAKPARGDKERFLRACAAGDIEAVRQALADRASVAAIGKAGITPLHLAAISRSVATVRALLEAGAGVDTAVSKQVRIPRKLFDKKLYAWDRGYFFAGETPLLTSLWRTPRLRSEPIMLPELARVLLAAGADPNAADQHRRGAVHLAAGYDGDPEVLALVLDAGADPDTPALIGGSPLIAAIGNRKADRELVRLLLDAGADPILPSGLTVWGVRNVTPLHAAALNAPVEMLATLLEAARDVDVRTDGGITPLHCAVKRKLAPRVEALIRAGADPAGELDDPAALDPKLTAKTPLEIARQLGHLEAAAVLERASSRRD